MVWPVLTILALAALLVLHFRWRRELAHARDQSRKEIRDLKDEHRREALQIQTQQEALFNSMVEGLLLLDQSGRIRLANDAFGALFGVVADVRGKTIMEALRLHELAELSDFLGTEKQVSGFELKLTGPPERWLQVNGAAIFSGAGGRHGTILVFHELTRLKQLESARKEFVANVSHELRTPLSLIKGYVETLLDGARDNPEVAVKFLQTIDRNAERLKLLIEDLLTLSQLESGGVKLDLQQVALRPVVEEVFADFKSRADARLAPARRAASRLKCSCATTAQAFRRKPCRVYSSGSIVWIKPAHANKAAPAWDCPSSSTSSKAIKAGSGLRANSARARRSTSRSPGILKDCNRRCCNQTQSALLTWHGQKKGPPAKAAPA